MKARTPVTPALGSQKFKARLDSIEFKANLSYLRAYTKKLKLLGGGTHL